MAVKEKVKNTAVSKHPQNPRAEIWGNFCIPQVPKTLPLKTLHVLDSYILSETTSLH